MLNSISALSDSIERNKFADIDEQFAAFSREFHNSLINEQRRSFFSKIFKRASIYDEGLVCIQECVAAGVFPKLSYVTLVRSLNDIFPFLMCLGSPVQIHTLAYSIFLDILSSLNMILQPEDMAPLGSILYHSTFLVPYETPADVNNELNKEKTDEFTESLGNLLLSHLNSHSSIFGYWWCVLCSSIIPPLTKSPNIFFNVDVDYEKIRWFDLSKIFDHLIVTLMKGDKHILSLFPELVLRLCHEVFIAKSYYIDQLFDSTDPVTLAEVFNTAIVNRDSQSVALFYDAVVNYIGSQLKDFPDNSGEYLKAKHQYKLLVIDAWSLFATNACNAQAVTDYLMQEMLRFPKPFTAFAILHLCYEANITMPDKLVSTLAQMDSSIRSSVVSFSCILACAFAHQFLHIDQSVALPCDRDCTTYVINIQTEADFLTQCFFEETRKTIRGILVTADTRSREEGLEYIDKFYNRWENNSGLLIPFACFTETLVSLVRDLSPDYGINIISVFSDLLLRFIGVADSSKPPELILVSVTTIIDIVSLRGVAQNLPANIAAKLSISLLRIISFGDIDISLKACDLCCKAILTGCPTFMATVPFLTNVLWQHSDVDPDQTILSAMIGARLFYKQFPGVVKSVRDIENRATQLYRISSDNLSELANNYFIMNKRCPLEDAFDPGFPLIVDDTVESMIDQLLACWWKRNSSMAILSAITTLLHCVVSRGSTPTKDFLEQFSSEETINTYLPAVSLGLDCITDIIKPLRKLNPEFVETYTEHLKNIFFLKQDVTLLYLITNIIITSDRKDELAAFYETLQERTPSHYHDFAELLMFYLSKIGETFPTALYNFSLDGAIAIALTSSHALQVIEAAGDVPVVISALASRRSAYTYKIIEKKSSKEENEEEIRKVNMSTEQEENVGSFAGKQNDPTAANEFEIFVKVRDAVASSEKKYLLTSPQDITNSNTDKPNETSPISSEDMPCSLPRLNDSLGIDFDGTFGALAALKLFGQHGFEASLPQDFRDLSHILSKRWIINSHVPVIFSRKGSKSIDQALKESWADVPTIFQQFCSSLGTPSKSGIMVYHNTWGADINFEIAPLMMQHAKDNQEWFSNAQRQSVQIIWYEGHIPNTSLNAGLSSKICITPLRTGLIRVDVLSGFGQSFGPLCGHNLVAPESLPSLIRSTVAALVCHVTKSISKNRIKIHENGVKNIRKIVDDIVIQEHQH